MAMDVLLRCVAVGIGGAAGSIARYGLSVWGSRFETRLPWGTFAANAVGCLLMGVVMFFVIERSHQVPEWVRLTIAVGLLGGLTTFSTFSYESMTLLREGHVGSVFVYITLSLVAGVGAAALGWFVADGVSAML